MGKDIDDGAHLRFVLEAELGDGEFVAAEPCRHIAVAQHVVETFRHAAQEFIRRLASEPVVDFLEMIDIDEMQSRHDRLRRGLGQLAGQLLGKAPAVRQLRQAVMAFQKGRMRVRIDFLPRQPVKRVARYGKAKAGQQSHQQRTE